MAEIPHRSEEELLAKLESWLTALGRPPKLAELIESEDGELFAAFTLQAFRRGARHAMVHRREHAAAALELSQDEVGNAAMRVFSGLSKAWQLTITEQAALLGLEASLQLDEVKNAEGVELSIGVIDRLAILLDIFEAISTLLPQRGSADTWIKAANNHPLFGGRSVLTVMMSGLEGMYAVRRYLLAERWGN